LDLQQGSAVALAIGRSALAGAGERRECLVLVSARALSIPSLARRAKFSKSKTAFFAM
jgi:hypothetical protein